MDVVFKTSGGKFNYRVAGVWIEKDAVLLHRSINDSHWALPGGRVSMMEESKVAVEREFLEELGIQVQVEKFLWSTENFFKYKEVNFIIQSFRCAEPIYSGVKPFSTIYWFDLAVLGNYEIDSKKKTSMKLDFIIPSRLSQLTKLIRNLFSGLRGSGWFINGCRLKS